MTDLLFSHRWCQMQKSASSSHKGDRQLVYVYEMENEMLTATLNSSKLADE